MSETVSDSTLTYYETHAESYAAATSGLSMASFATRFAEQLPPRSAVLDAGCGSGRDLRALSLLNLHATGLDRSPRLAALAARYSGCRVVIGDLRNLPFVSGTFAGVWAAASLLHLPREQLEQGLRECRRVLVDGGVFFCSMKAGHGEKFDADGRWFTYVTPGPWNSLLSDTRFRIRDQSLTNDIRETENSRGWITTFSRAI